MASDPDPAFQATTRAIIDRARAAQSRDPGLLAQATGDLFLPDEARLDEQARLAIARSLTATIAAVTDAIRRHAARLLAGWGREDRADLLIEASDRVQERLAKAGLLADRALMAELIARVRLQLLSEALAPVPGPPDRPSLIVRLAEAPDPVVASAARALLAAESRRRSSIDEQAGADSGLPPDVHHRLVWWVAAALRMDGEDDLAVGRALAEAAQRSLAAHDEGDRPEVLATRLAVALDARVSELPGLLVEALADRRILLFTALLARATGFDPADVRAMLLDPDGDRLLLALRAIDLDRATIARIGYALSQADPRRDLEAFADRLDALVSIDPARARVPLAAFALPGDFRAAITALDSARSA